MVIENKTFDQERALYGISETVVKNCRFSGPADGESFLKECRSIQVQDCFMDLRYPLWHLDKGSVSNCILTNNCRAAFWYDKDLLIENSTLNGIKAVRECENVIIKNCKISSPEFIWKVNGLNIDNIEITDSEYPFFEVTNGKIKNLKLTGKYSFQYDSNLEIEKSILNTKDAFWHSKNVTIKDSEINGEYLGWYSENLTFINCKITGTQPFCYCKNLILQNCSMINCDLAFEKSTVSAQIIGKIESIKNPISGQIFCEKINNIILDETDKKNISIIQNQR